MLTKISFENADDRQEALKSLLRDYNVPDCLFPYDWLCSTDFFTAPASCGYHAAYEGGLFDHCFNVTRILLDWREKELTSVWMRPESPILVGMLHDVTKIDRYIKETTKDPNEIRYTKNPLFFGFGGHGYDSACKAELHCSLTEEEKACIQYHMGAYEEDWDAIDYAIQKYPNVLWTHTADMVASKLMED